MKWIPLIIIFALALFYIYRSEDTTPAWEDQEQAQYLQEWNDKKRAKQGKFYDRKYGCKYRK